MASDDIRGLTQYQRKKRIGEENTGEDPFTDPDMYGSPSMSTPTPSVPMKRASGEDPTIDYQRILDAMKQYEATTDHSASDRFDNLLSKYPAEKSPGITRTLVAIGAGLGKGGVKAGQDILDEPHKKDLEDWKNKIQPTYEAANVERQSNVNDRQLFGNMMTADVNNRRYINAAQSNDERNRIAAQKVTDQAAHQKRVDDLLDLKTKGYTYSVIGNKLMGHAQDGSSFEAGEASSYDPVELEKLKQQGRMEVVKQQGANAVTTKTTKPGFNVETIKPTAAQTAASKPLTAKEANDARSAELRRILETDPEGEGRFIKMAPDGVTAILKSRPTYGIPYWGDDDNKKEIDAYDALNKRVTESIAPPKGAPSNTPTTTPSPAGQTSGGGMYILQKDGENPSRRRKSYDGGKTWSYSTDGGKTWDGGQ